MRNSFHHHLQADTRFLQLVDDEWTNQDAQVLGLFIIWFGGLRWLWRSPRWQAVAAPGIALHLRQLDRGSGGIDAGFKVE